MNNHSPWTIAVIAFLTGSMTAVVLFALIMSISYFEWFSSQGDVLDWITGLSGWAAFLGAIFVGIWHLPWIKGQAQYPALQERFMLASQRLSEIDKILEKLENLDKLISRAEKSEISEQDFDKAATQKESAINAAIANYVTQIPELIASLGVSSRAFHPFITAAFLRDTVPEQTKVTGTILEKHKIAYNYFFSLLNIEREKQKTTLIAVSQRINKILLR